jgi:hypothetical protein
MIVCRKNEDDMLTLFVIMTIFQAISLFSVRMFTLTVLT